MTRKKVKLAFITNDSARKASLKKRRVGLLKKVSELTILCGVDAFVIIYSPDDNEAAVWPSPPQVQQLLARYQSIPEMERSKKMMNQESYLKERVGKEEDQIKKLNKKRGEAELDYLMHQIHQGKPLDDFHVHELQTLALLIDEKRKDIRRKADFFQQVNPPSAPAPPPRGPVPWDHTGRIVTSGDDGKPDTDPHMWVQWLNVRGGRGEIGLAHNTYIGSSIAVNDTELYHESQRGHASGSDMGLPHGDTGGNAVGDRIGQGFGMQPHGNIEGGGSATDAEPGLQSHVTGGSSTGGSDGGLHAGLFGGGSSGGSDVGMPFDVTKTKWNLSP
ncbi:SRF-TF domain-containing protein [Cephalotus follicularis]|uniref:SRF-TF domain-containing protein n=1 Tax=Cephalotus follicularis TaxID=3775 RepID=A0A1Q3B7Q0_CEPFO|nr:SRF-TF domain-containing protein [Cephalotus follicularis]